MPPQGTTATRIEVLERQVEMLLREAAIRPVRTPSARPTYHGFWAITCAPEGDSYPSAGANTYYVKIVEAAFSPSDNDGATTRTLTERSSEGLFVARNAGPAYVPEGTLVRIECSRVRGAKAQWWFHFGADGTTPLRFRLTTSMSVFGTANGRRQKWDGAAYVDDGDFPDTVTLVDYAGVASSGDVNDKCFSVAMADRPDVYEVVEIQQAGSAPFVLFKIDDTGGLTHAMATVDALVVLSYGAGLDPDDPITVRNFETHTAGVYRFAAPNTYRGLAFYNGTDWSIVELEEPVKFAQIEFTCNETVTTSDASFDAEITRLIGDAALLGVEEEDVITVHNRADITDYVFTGSNLTSVGLAQWDSVLGRWDAIWITCPAEE
jgi:hypothetical protein